MTAVLVVALFLSQQTPQHATPPEKCTISGTVVDSITGLPLAKAEVVAEHVGNHDPGASTATDAKGSFLIVDVEPGQYQLLAQRNGYLDTHYGAKRSDGKGSTMTLTAGQNVEGLEIRISPVGTIAGVIRDSDGEALVGAEVSVRALRYRNGQREVLNYASVHTDDLGQYRVTNLPPGKYFISAEAYDRYRSRVDHSIRSSEPPEVPITTFYPGTADPDTAKPVTLAAGERRTGADITIIRSRLYTVKVHVEAPAGLHASAALFYRGETPASDDGVGKSRQLEGRGDVEITDVPPGSYRLQFGAGEPTKAFDGVIDVTAHNACHVSIPLSVGRANLDDVRVVASGCGVIGGSVRDENGKPPARTACCESVFFRSSFQGGGLLRADGTFSDSLPPGHYLVDLPEITHDLGLYVKSIRAGTQDVLRGGVTLQGAERIDLEIVLAADGGQVDGVVLTSEEKLVAGASVVLVPNDPVLRARLDSYWDVVTDQAGHFELKNIAPGEYKLLAWDDVEEGVWFDPEVLKDYEAKGEPVTVKVKDSQTLKLRVIP